MIGRTTHTIIRNIIDPMKEILGNSVRYLAGRQTVNFFGRTIHVIPASDGRAESRLRGSTVVGAYVDEATLIPENFFKMLLSRLSMPGAKLFATTNPDSPLHWLKKDFLDRISKLDLKEWHFELSDNPSLEKEYINQIKNEYVGLWYNRYILGEWVQAEGAVYDFFDQDIHCMDYPTNPAQSYILGVDYGTSNAFAAVLIGINRNYYPNVWVEDEYYWNPKKEMRQKTNVEYADDLKNFIEGKYIEAIYVDPSAASFKLELRRNGFEEIYDAQNEVVDGIRKVAEYLAAGTLKICSKAKNLIAEIQGYCWDPKAQERGEDKPIKMNDHALDALRYAIYSHFFGNDMSNPLTPKKLDELYNESRGITNNLPRFFQDPNQMY
jgi:PBSX family phage terminase large subunit